MNTWNSDGSDTIETRIYMPTNTERRAHPPRHHDSIRRERQMLSLPRRFPPLSGGYALHFANGAAPFVVKSIRQRWTREPCRTQTRIRAPATELGSTLGTAENCDDAATTWRIFSSCSSKVQKRQKAKLFNLLTCL